MQNRSHIKHLKSLLGEQFPMRSIIVFSDRCTLKSVQIKSNDISVINRYDVSSVVSAICNQTPTDILSESNITELYNKLYPFTQVDEFAKAQHITNIRNNLNEQPIRQTAPKYAPSGITTLQTEATNVTTVIQAEVNSVGVETVVKDLQSPVVESTEKVPVEGKPMEKQISKCPRCNGNLVLRTATRGANAGDQFYGCSNYPKCKYIQSITNKTV
ncbi:MAG: topoisomerase DNA-binding C4 zinc finger domain-containing protein [Clostridia bacterium]|nr:topoisomerase DNA-binding C4 zinc finger domain-containing protein [Clostridia bacterium]